MSKTLDFNLAFPEPITPGVIRGPLPKQLEFLERSLAPGSPKYIRYVGGI